MSFGEGRRRRHCKDRGIHNLEDLLRLLPRCGLQRCCMVGADLRADRMIMRLGALTRGVLALHHGLVADIGPFEHGWRDAQRKHERRDRAGEASPEGGVAQVHKWGAYMHAGEAVKHDRRSPVVVVLLHGRWGAGFLPLAYAMGGPSGCGSHAGG